MNSLNSIEKLIQMATIEQMYTLLNKMKDNNTSNIFLDENILSKNESSSNTENLNNTFITEQYNLLNNRLNVIENKLDIIIKNMNNLNKIDSLFTLLNDINEKQNNTSISNDFLQNAVLSGQKKLTDYIPDYQKNILVPSLDLSKCEKNTILDEKQNITLTIIDPEKTVRINSEISTEQILSEDDEVVSEEEVCTDIDDTDSLTKQIIENPCKDESLNQNNIDKPLINSLDIELNNSEDEEEIVEEEIVEEEEQEELVEDEEEQEELVEEEEQEELVEEEEQEELEESVEKQEEQVEEEEEVFEIEIDDITYYATDENNGVLYESTKDGDIGKKVGIIKDGEPIFDE